MTRKILHRVDRWMRIAHLFTGLFLVPWMMVYALSAFALNHNQTVTELLHVAPTKWEVVDRQKFVPPADFPEEATAQAQAILRHLQLDGAHRIAGQITPQGFTIFRPSASRPRRIRWERGQQQLIVERQNAFSVVRLIHYLHFRGGYDLDDLACRTWAAIVDLVALSIVTWVVSGLYIWLRSPRYRISGGIALLAGLVLFGVLVWRLCQ